MPGRISGWTVGYTAVGGIILWSGITGTTLSTTFQDLLNGQAPTQNQETITAVTQTTAAGSSGSVSGSSTSLTNLPGTNVGPTTGTAAANEAAGRLLAAPYGWSTGAQWTALNNVVMKESGWNNTAQNPTSTAYGIGQFLDTTWATVGYTKTSVATTQIAAMLKYIKQRYGTPEGAWAMEESAGYY